MTRQKKRVKVIYWVVDVQNDFMKPDGALAVKDADTIVENLKNKYNDFSSKGMQIVFTKDWHFEKSEELSSTPDYKTTFPNHCMAYTDGAKLIDIYDGVEDSVEELDWTQYYNYQDLCEIAKSKEIIIKKDKFDVFAGNKYTEQLLSIIQPDVVYVSGVATNVCVDQAVMGLLKRGIEVRVITNTIKELPNLPVHEVIDVWVSNGAKLI